jgi:hypothetical protein
MLEKIINRLKAMPIKDKISLMVIAVVALVLIFSRPEANGAKNIIDQAAYVEKTAKQKTARQAKLVLLKIFVRATSYGEDRVSFADMNIMKMGYIYEGSVDVIIDFTSAEISTFHAPDGEVDIVVSLPQPKIDESTVAIDPSGIILKIEEGVGFRSESARQALVDSLKKNIHEDMQSTFADKSLIEEAFPQAKMVLTAFYKSCGARSVEIKWTNNNIKDWNL